MKFLKRNLLVLLILFGLFSSSENLTNKESSLHSYINKSKLFYHDMDFDLYEFVSQPVPGKRVKVTYLVHDAFEKFKQLKAEKTILLVTAASFTSTFFYQGTPIGLCAYEGEFLNKMPDQDMDGLVVTNSEGLIPANYIFDLDSPSGKFDIQAKNYSQLNPRENILESYYFQNWIEEKGLSVFQTQLLYTQSKSVEENFHELNAGSSHSARRFLVLAQKNGISRNVIVDSKQSDYIMKTAKEVYGMLTESGYDVQFILNLDTGSKNLLYVNNGNHLENLLPNATTQLARIERASNLLVFYYE